MSAHTRRVGVRLGALVVALSLLSACGLRLQGRMPLPTTFAKTYVDASNEQSEFVQSLRKRLLVNGVELVNSEKLATAVIKVRKDEIAEEVLSVSARNLPREYELTYIVEFSVSAGTEELLAGQKVELTRDFTFDETIKLAKEREQEILEEALGHDLADIVMRRLAAL